MVRTRENCARKAVASKAPRKALAAVTPSSSCASPSSSKNKYAGGNPVCPRPVPEWQKGIQGFFKPMTDGETSKNEEVENLAPEEQVEESASGSSSACAAAAGSSSSSS